MLDCWLVGVGFVCLVVDWIIDRSPLFHLILTHEPCLDYCMPFFGKGGNRGAAVFLKNSFLFLSLLLPADLTTIHSLPPFANDLCPSA